MGSKACVQTKATIKLLSHTKVLVVLVFIWIWIDGNQDWDNRSLDKQLHKEDHEIRANTLLILVVRQKTCNKESEIYSLVGFITLFMIFGPSTYLRRKDLKEPL